MCVSPLKNITLFYVFLRKLICIYPNMGNIKPKMEILTMKIRAIKTDDEMEKLITELKKEKKNNNFSQICREALWSYAQKILPNFTQICINGEKNG